MPTLKASELSSYGCFSVESEDGSALVVPCCGASLNSKTGTHLSAKEQRQTHNIQHCLNSCASPGPSDNSQQWGLTCRPTCRKKRNSICQSGPLCLTKHSQVIPGKQSSYKHLYGVSAFRNLSPSTQKPFPTVTSP